MQPIIPTHGIEHEADCHTDCVTDLAKNVFESVQREPHLQEPNPLQTGMQAAAQALARVNQ